MGADGPGEGEGGAGLEVVVVGEADDAESLEDGVAEDGGDDVGLLLAGADGEVGVGEDEKDYVVDGGGAEGSVSRMAMWRGFSAPVAPWVCATPELRVRPSWRAKDSETTEKLAPVSRIQGVVMLWTVRSAVMEERRSEWVGRSMGGGDVDGLGRGVEEELDGVGVVLIVFEEGGGEAGGGFGEEAGVEGGGLGVAEEFEVGVGEGAEDEGAAGGGEVGVVARGVRRRMDSSRWLVRSARTPAKRSWVGPGGVVARSAARSS